MPPDTTTPATIMHYIQLMAGTVLIYHAFIVQRLGRTYASIPYSGVVGMSLAAATYYFLLESYQVVSGNFGTRLIAHGIWVAGPLVILFHIQALETYLDLHQRWMAWAKKIILGLTSIAVLSALSYLFFGHMLLFSPEPMNPGPLALPEHVRHALSPNPLSAFVIMTLTLIEVSSFAYFVREMMRRKADRWLLFGLILSLLAVLNELLVAALGSPYGFSLYWIANLVEILRLTALIEKENRDRQRRVESTFRLAQVGELTATVAHELNTPLTAVMTSAELGARLATRDLPEEIRLRQLFERISGGAKRMADITRTLGMLSRETSLRPITFDVSRSTQEVAALLTPMFAADQVSLTLRIDESLPPLSGDPGRFQQILINLLQNARDATDGKLERKIDVLISSGDRKITLRVSDNGHGIPEEIQEKIFLPFFTSKPPGKGTGIGLWFVQAEIQAMRGAIRVLPGMGTGTTFEITLPASGQSADPTLQDGR